MTTTTTRPTPSAAEVANEYAVWSTGLGIVSFALFPFLLPGIAILAVFALPLLVVPIAGGLVAAVIAVPWLAVRALRRRAARRRRAAAGSADGESVQHRQVELA
jgi:small neutral amino acid transporter SnatA (MarC family)